MNMPPDIEQSELEDSRPEETSGDPVAALRSSFQVSTGSIDRAWLPPSNELMDFSELRNLLSQYPPMVTNEIIAIEKGMENFFLFNESHMALYEESRLEHLQPKDVESLQKKGVLVRFEYFNLSDQGELTIRKVIIRPASLRGDLVGRALNACIRGSAIALIKYIYQRNLYFQDLDREKKLADFIALRLRQSLGNEASLEQSIQLSTIPELSFDRFIETQFRPDATLLRSLVLYLTAPASSVREDLKTNSDLADDILPYLEQLGERPVIIPFSDHLLLPSPIPGNLIELDGELVREVRTEIEWIYLIFIRAARKFLFQLLPSEKTGWIEKEGNSQDQQFLEELRKHPSFLHSEQWEGSGWFLEAYERLIKEARLYQKIRKDLMIEMIVNESLKKLNGQFEPVYFDAGTFEIPDPFRKRVKSAAGIFSVVMEHIRNNKEVLVHESPQLNGETGYYLIYRYNVPGAFIRNPSLRSMIHLMARKNEYPQGIYSFLVQVNESTHPSSVVKEQIDLTRAIRDWEEELRKEREKKIRANKPFFQRFIDLVADLLSRFMGGGNASPSPVLTKSVDEILNEEIAPSVSEEKRKTGVIVGPREKKIRIPSRMQRAIDQVEKNNKGIIWLDLVLRQLSSVKFNENMIGDALYYDQKGRYLEIKSLREVRRAFVRVENEENPAWRASVRQYLENVAVPDQGIKELIEHYRFFS